MTTIPQLRKDIHDLQAENRRLKEELSAERNKPPRVKEVIKEVTVPGPVRVVKEPAPPPRVVTKVIEKPTPGPVRVVNREVERVVYRDNPKHIDMIRKLQGKKDAV